VSHDITYDELRRLLTAQRGPDTNIQRKYSYDYDRFGNRWAQTLVAGSGFGGTNSFDYAGNRVTTTNFTYDNSGNLTANGPGTSFTFNAENFMTAAGASATYSVDTRGRRTKKTVSGTTTNYFYSGSVVISEKLGSTWTDYIFFSNQRIAQQTGSTLTVAKFLHQDHLGSTRVCSDGSGNSAGTCDYEPFGEFQPGSACSNLPTNYRFAGMYYDSESGLYYTWFRQYDANQGRWMGVDPLPGSPSDPQSLDRYAYVAGDPPNLIDPVGLSATCRPPCVLDTERDNCVCPDPPDLPGMHFVDIPGACLVIYKNGIQIFNSCRGGTEPIPRPDRDGRNRGPAIGAPQKPPAQQPQPCVDPNWLQRLGIKAQGWLAKLTGKTVGVGAGGSGAIGRSGLGVAGGVSRQVVVSPNGQAAFETSFSFNSTGLPGPTFGGAGALGGLQVSFSNAQDPGQLAGPFLQGTFGVGAGYGGGVDVALGAGNIVQVTLTGGVGVGGKGAAGLMQLTAITPICTH